jgi:hypothetical protein
VPRQGSTRPSSRPYADEYQEYDEYEERPTRQAPTPQRHRPQQPPYRTARQEPVDAYEDVADYLDDEDVYDDRVIETDRATRRPSPAPSPRPASRRTASRASEAQLYEDEYADDDYDHFDDGFIDEDDWYEEEAAAGAYRPRQRGARGTGRSVPRPNVSIPRPTLPRPTVPVAVREAALVQDQSALMLAGALVMSVIAMGLLAMNRIDTLAPGFATRISASGIQEAFRTEDALWQLPLMAGALLVMNLVIAWFLAPHSRFSARFMLISSMLVQVVIWVALFRIAF